MNACLTTKANSCLQITVEQLFSPKKLAVLLVLVINTVSGCTVIDNSEGYYRDNPPRTHYGALLRLMTKQSDRPHGFIKRYIWFAEIV
jgi:hypothetical protein